MPALVASAVVIPGIMGSCLAYTHSGTPEPIWTECFLDNYRRLARQPASLQYNGLAASAPRLLEFAYLKDVLWWKQVGRRDLWTGLLEYLRNHRDFTHAQGVIEFPYDWRESLTRTARNLGSMLNARLGGSVQAPAPVRLSIITHSMGGLVARIALMDGHIHPANVQRLVHIAPPLMGSASALRSLFSSGALPFLDTFVAFCHTRKNGSLALENLRRVMATFPSIYQLLPPLTDKFLYVGAGVSSYMNPLEAGQSVIPALLQAEAHAVHTKLFRATMQLPHWGIPVHTIYSKNGSVTTDEQYRVFVEPDRYEILSPIPYREALGDGTVTARSCSYDGADSADLREVVGENHPYMCQSENVLQVLKTLM